VVAEILSMTRTAKISVIMIVIIFHAHCIKRSSPSPPLAASIVGKWKSETYQTQLGPTIQTFCFGADGEVIATAKTHGATLANKGKYSLNQNRVTFTWLPASTAVFDIEWSGNDLIVIQNGKRVRFRLVGRRC
jgi:hypothetical protein